MPATRPPRCPRCDAELRRGRPAGSPCDPCTRRDIDVRQVLGPDFYTDPTIRALLECDDFGGFFRRVRAHTGWTQETLAAVVGLDQADISKMERRVWWLSDYPKVRRIAQRLFIPTHLLGFSPTVAESDTQRKVASWVDRRHFTSHVAGLILGITAAAGLDLDRLTALLPVAEPAGPTTGQAGTRRVGVGDVELIEELTATFVRQDFAHGSGGLLRAAAMDQLRTALPLLNAQTSSEVGPRLQLAIARLATQAGWMSFECHRHDTARRLWLLGLDLARSTDHPLGADLTVFLLYDMTLQAVHLNHPDEATHLVRIAETATVGHPVSASTSCALANVQARAYAAQGDPAGLSRALGQAEEHRAEIDPATGPPWGAHVGETGMFSFQGSAYYTLAQHTPSPRTATQAVTLLGQGIEHLGPGYTRLRALYLPNLSGAHALAGDTDTAVSIGHQAVDTVTALSSPRAYDQLRTLHTVLQPMHTNPDVAELRDRLTTTAT